MKKLARATVAMFDKLRRTGKGIAETDGLYGTTVTLWPNGNREIWVKSGDQSLGFSIQFSEGPHGLSAKLYYFGGSLSEHADVRVDHFGNHVEICQYRPDAKAQAFKRWYAHEETEADIALLGEDYRRKQSA